MQSKGKPTEEIESTLPAARRQSEAAPAQDGTPSPAPDPLSSLPLWQRRYILALRAGATEQEAQLAGNCSAESIQAFMAKDLSFARARDACLYATPADRLAMRALGESLGATMLLDAYMESRGRDPETGERATETVHLKDGTSVEREAILPRDRLGNRRLVLEAAGAIGQGSAPSSGITVQGNAVIQIVQQVQALTPEDRALSLERARARLRELQEPRA